MVKKTLSFLYIIMPIFISGCAQFDQEKIIVKGVSRAHSFGFNIEDFHAPFIAKSWSGTSMNGGNISYTDNYPCLSIFFQHTGGSMLSFGSETWRLIKSNRPSSHKHIQALRELFQLKIDDSNTVYVDYEEVHHITYKGKEGLLFLPRNKDHTIVQITPF